MPSPRQSLTVTLMPCNTRVQHVLQLLNGKAAVLSFVYFITLQLSFMLQSTYPVYMFSCKCLRLYVFTCVCKSLSIASSNESVTH